MTQIKMFMYSQRDVCLSYTIYHEYKFKVHRSYFIFDPHLNTNFIFTIIHEEL